jgi:hypothetical protein
MVTAYEVDIPPGPGWNPAGATNLPDTWYLIDKHRPPDLPMSTAQFVTIFFEETACCNMVQQGCPVGIGPGQLQVSEIGKVYFFAGRVNNMDKDNFLGQKWDSSKTEMAVNQKTMEVHKRTKSVFSEQERQRLKELTEVDILGNNEFAIKMHVKFMQWLAVGHADGQRKSLRGLLGAQVGPKTAAKTAFLSGAAALEAVMQPDPNINFRWSPDEWKAYYAKRRPEFINALNVARNGIHGNPVPARYTKFWEFFIPDAFLQNPLGNIRCGF